MPINSTLDVVIQEDDLVVLGPPTTVDIDLNIGAQGDPGSQIYSGDFDPNTLTSAQFSTLYGAAPQGNDLFLRTDIGENYGVFYSYVSVPGGVQWEPILEIQEAVELFLNSNTNFILSASAGGTGVNNGSNTLTFGGDIDFGNYDFNFNTSGDTTLTFPTSGSVAVWQDSLGNFAPTTSAELANVITDETGTGYVVFSTSPNIDTSLTTSTNTFDLINENATTVNFAGAASAITIGASAGLTTINNSLTVGGNLVVNGNTTTVNSTVVSIDDPVFTLGGDEPAPAEDGKDRGIQFRHHDGTTAKIGFFGLGEESQRFRFILDATNTSEVFTGTLGDIEATNFYGDLIGNADTASAWETARTLTLDGDLGGSVAIDGSGDATLTATIQPNSVELGTDTTGNYISIISGTTNEIEVFGSGSESASVIVGLPNDVTITNNLSVNGSQIDTDSTTFDLINTNATTVNIAGAATGLSIGSSSGLTTINNDLLVSASHYATVDALQLDTTPGVSASVGRFIWDDGDGTAHITLKGGNVDLSIGQEEVALCYNGSGSPMTDGQVVYIAGAQGQRPDIRLASSLSESGSSKTFGVVTEPIADGEEGFVATFGLVKGINTEDFAEGSALWLSASAGVFTDQMPQSPEHAVFIGYVVKSNQSSGQIFVNIQNGYEIEELHNVLITSASANDVLRYNAASGLWVNEDISTVVNSASVINAQNINISGDLDVSGTITGDITGNSDTATALQTARTISLIGDVSGSASFDGTSDISISASVQLDSIELGVDTTGDYVQNITGTTNEIEVSGSGESANVQIGLPNNVSITNDLTVGGNLTVSGSVVYLNVEELLIEDNLITLNSGVTGSPNLNAGVEVERGTENNVSIRWNETTDEWEFTNNGTTYDAIGSGGGFTNHFLMMGA